MMTGLIQRGVEGSKTVLKLTEDLTQQIIDEKGEQAPDEITTPRFSE